MQASKKLSPIVTELFMRVRKLTCFYTAILFRSAERCKTKCGTLFYDENR